MKEKMNMRIWKENVIASDYKRGVPVLSYPSVQLMGISVKELISSSSKQAQGMKLIADRCPSLASLSMMDLTVEAEAFGAEVRMEEDEIPTVKGALVKTLEDAQNLVVPEVGAGRTQVYIDAMKEACELITDRPVFAGIAGPFTLAGRLIGITQTMKAVKKQPEMVKIALRKATDFIIKYALAYKEQTGANGFVMAEPLSGILGPKMETEFSAPYVKEIIEAVQDEQFIVIYHNCGDNVVSMAKSIASMGAEGYHFGNVINMEDIISDMPSNTLVMGNVDPAGKFCIGTPEEMRADVDRIMDNCCKWPNFVISSGCDIGPGANWECIDAFFDEVKEYYGRHGITE